MAQAARYRLETERGAGAARSVRLGGELTLDEGPGFWSELAPLIAGRGDVEFDLGDVERLDGAGAAMLLELRARVRQRGDRGEFVRASPENAGLLDRYGCPLDAECILPPPRKIGIFEHVGKSVVEMLGVVRGILAFVGDLVLSTVAALRAPHTLWWRDLGRLMERAGADGAPIVLLINFLVGLIMALQAAEQLQRFGADVFVANLVGLSMTRELGPLMTAIVVAGRSGAAYAAELGTMKVSEEVDALHTLGLDPQRFLVLPRVVALTLVVPILTLGGVFVGCIGGLLVGVTTLDLTAAAYLGALRSALDIGDVFGGLVKSAAFAAMITLVACQRGLAARKGAAGVGASTTSAVVTILFSLIVIDAMFTLLYNAIGV